MTQTADQNIQALSERLLAEFDGRVSAETVLRCLQAARHAVRYFGEEPADLPRVLERIVRADLQQIADGRESSARVFGVNRRRAGEEPRIA